MEARREPLKMFGGPGPGNPAEWAGVEARISAAELYWLVATPRSGLPPHPRPVWGVFEEGQLHLSIGSPTIRRDIDAAPLVAVHLEDALDVVLLEGHVTGQCADPTVIAAYDAKYDWVYDLAEYGPLTTIAVDVVMAWVAAGAAGRDGFTRSGRWRLTS
ncbi:MAG TPA: hypothetical protein VF855_07950 [Acidimicrobiales bacterium]